MTPEDELINEALEYAIVYWDGRAEPIDLALRQMKANDTRRHAFEQMKEQYLAKKMTFMTALVRRTR